MQFVKCKGQLFAHIILWPLFFEETSSNHFVKSILTPLLREFTEEKIYDIVHSLQELKGTVWRKIASILEYTVSCVKKYC